MLGDKLDAGGASKNYIFKEILENYAKYSKKSIKNLTTIDFCVVTEGIGLEAKILTCDLKMYNATKKHYGNIYFVTDKVGKQTSDLGRLIQDIQRDR